MAPQVKQRLFHGTETPANALILNGLLKTGCPAISISLLRFIWRTKTDTETEVIQRNVNEFRPSVHA